MQDDLEDMLEQVNEVQEIMSRSYGVPDDIDEDELQAGTKLLLLWTDIHLMTLTIAY